MYHDTGLYRDKSDTAPHEVPVFKWLRGNFPLFTLVIIPVTYFALDDSGENGVQANMCSEYINISPNKIAEEGLRLYDMEITKAFKGDS